MNRRILCLGWLAATGVVHAQLTQMSVMQSSNFTYRRGPDDKGVVDGVGAIQFRSIGYPIVEGAPFSGEERRSSVQVLSDGTRVTFPLPSGQKVFRDSRGRTRMERIIAGGSAPIGRANVEPFVLIEINDTVDNYYYLLDSQNKVAYRSKYSPILVVPSGRTAPGPAAASSPPPARKGLPPTGLPQSLTEDLGTRIIQGVPAEGQKQTTVIPVGYRGNDRPLTNVNETWISPQLQLMVLLTSKSASGESALEIANLSLVEPSANLFRPPPGYQVIDKEGPFTIEFFMRPAASPGTPR